MVERESQVALTFGHVLAFAEFTFKPPSSCISSSILRLHPHHATFHPRPQITLKMSQRTLVIPLRLATSARPSSQSYTCLRCLSTTTPSTPSSTVHASYGPNPVENYDPRLPASARPKHPETGTPLPLKKTDFYLKKPLPSQFIPPQHLQHTEADWLHENERKQRDRLQVPKKIVGVVVSAGKMEKTVKVRVPGRRWEPKIGKVR